MGLNFPAAPLIGDVYPMPALPGVPQWTWNGTSWKCGTIDTANYLLKSGGTMTGPIVLPADPANALEATPKQYVDAFAGNNLLINGFIDVSQENGGTAVAPNGWAADQWLMQAVAGFTAQSQSGGPLAGGGIDKQLGLISPASYSHAAANSAYFTQYIEGLRFAKVGWGTAGGRPVSLGLWVYSNAGGVMSVTMRNGGSTRAYVIPLTIPANSWVYRTATFPPCPDGAWPTDNTSCANFFVSFLPTTSLIAAAANSWQPANVIVAPTATQMFTSGTQTGNYIAGVTLIPGSTPVPQSMCPLMRRDYADELRLCQRYWEKVGMTMANESGVYGNTAFFKVTKRISPTIALIAGGVAGATYGLLSHSPLDGMRQLGNPSGAIDALFSISARM